MSIENLQQLLTVIQGFVVQVDGEQVFQMPAAALKVTAIQGLIQYYLAPQTGVFTVSSPTSPAIFEDTVLFEGDVVDLLGLPLIRVTVSFDLLDQGNPSLLVKVPIIDPTWNLGTSFSIWQELRSPLTRITFNQPTFYYTSIQRPAAPPRPVLEPNLNFTAAQLHLEGILGVLAKLPNTPQFNTLSGAIVGDATAPLMQLTATPTQLLPFNYLSLPLTFRAVSGLPSNEGIILSPPAPVDTYLELATSLSLSPSIPPIPIAMRFGRIGALLTFSANLAQLSSYALSEFDSFVHQAPISSYLDSYLKIVEDVQLKTLSVSVDTNTMTLAAVSLGVGTANALTVVPGYVELPNVDVTFMVNDPVGRKAITAMIVGEFEFLQDIDVVVTALFPQLIFTGGLKQDQPLHIQDIFRKFLPSLSSIPPVEIDDLYISADLTNKIYNFQLSVSQWLIPVGIASINIEQGFLQLQSQSGTSSSFSGEIGGIAVVLDQAGNPVAELFMDWNLPNDFLLRGIFPEIPLSQLAITLTGGYLSTVSGLPEINLINSQVELRISQEGTPRIVEGTTYDFSLSTSIQVDKFGLVNLLFELRKTPASTGFVAGLVVVPGWNPAAIWSGLTPVFNVVVLKEAGLILSSLAQSNLTLQNFSPFAYVPSTIKPGVTFFAALEMQGDVFSLLQKLFGEGVNFRFDLYAYIDTSNLNQSEIVASLPAEKINSNITWQGLTIDLQPGQEKFSLQAGAIFTVQGEQLSLIGAGSITFQGDPSINFGISIANWLHPFGLQGLNIEEFGLTVALAAGEFTIGLLGKFQVGTGADQFQFLIGGEIIDFEAPGAFVFALDASNLNQPLKVTDLIYQFTRLDLSSVPLLNGLAFKQLDFYVVDDPKGWQAPPPDNHFYPFGLGVNADLLFYSLEIKLFMQVSYNQGIIASGSINEPIEIAGFLKISDETGTTGPSASIDTSSLIPPTEAAPVLMSVTSQEYREALPAGALAIRPTPAVTILTLAETKYFYFSGGIDILGLVDLRFSGSATNGGFEANFFADLANIYRASFFCSVSKSGGLVGSTSNYFDFNATFPNGLSVLGIKIIPDGTTIHGPNAFLKIDCTINTQDAMLALQLEFYWGSVHINTSFSLDAKQIASLLADLWNQIVHWIETNAQQFLADLLSSVERYIDLLKSGTISLVQDIDTVVRFLYHYFQITTIEEMARKLIEIARYSFKQMVEVLAQQFQVSWDKAAQVLGELSKTCAIAAAQSVIYSSPQLLA